MTMDKKTTGIRHYSTLKGKAHDTEKLRDYGSREITLDYGKAIRPKR